MKDVKGHVVMYRGLTLKGTLIVTISGRGCQQNDPYVHLLIMGSAYFHLISAPFRRHLFPPRALFLKSALSALFVLSSPSYRRFLSA